MTWISFSHAATLLQISERRLRDRAGDYTTRENGRAANGKPLKEFLLESLPVEAQSRFYKSEIRNPQSEIEISSPVAVHTSGDAESGSDGASPSPGAPDPTLSAPPSLILPRAAGEERGGGLNGLNEAELSQLNDLADILRQVAAREVAPEHAATCTGMSLSTLRRKLRALKKHGVAGLARKTRADRGQARVADQKVVARIKTEFLQPHRPAASHVYASIAKDYEMSGLTPPSYSFVLRKTKEIDPDLVARLRAGEKTFDDRFAFITLRRKPALPRQWCDADHHEMDHIVIFADGSIGRPWLTAIQDICTNEVLGYVLTREKRSTYPGAQAIGLTLRNAILRKEHSQSEINPKFEIQNSKSSWPSFGLFDNFYTDLGKDFRSQHIRAVCADLGIKTVPARGYHGKSKPIERWFGVLEAGLKHLPGYVGRSPETNPLRQDVGAPRSWEDLRGEIMTIDDFEAALHRWIVAEFHHAESRALKGLSPMGVLEMHVKNGWRPREVSSERVLDLLLMHRKSKKVQRFGIEMFGSHGVQRFFMAPELVSLVGQEVEVYYDPAKIGELIVYKDDRFLCKAQNRELIDFGASEEDLKRERELKREQRRRIDERYQQLLMQAQYPNPLARATAERRREKVMEEEREKIAVNATPEQRIYKLLPKFQIAAKALHDGRTITAVQSSKVQRSTSGRVERLNSEAVELLNDELKSADELFRAEKNPWLEEDDR